MRWTLVALVVGAARALVVHSPNSVVSLQSRRPLRVVSCPPDSRRRARVTGRSRPMMAAIVSPAVTKAVAVNSVLAVAGIVGKQGVLTPAGLAHAWLLGVVLLGSYVGWQGYTTCVMYLILGSAVTKIRQREKEAEGIAEKRGGARGPENVWGSALTAALCALAGSAMPALQPALTVAFVASLATKLSDTTQSEIGKAYGKTTYLITTLKKVPRGTEGAVSLEGTLAGVVASVVLPAYAVALGWIGWAAIPICVVAASIATTCESLLGATVQGNVSFLTNEVINFFNTLIGAAVAAALSHLLGLS